jgi:hypothetical protein
VLLTSIHVYNHIHVHSGYPDVGAFARTIAHDKVVTHSMVSDIFALLPECNHVEQPIAGLVGVAAAGAAVAAAGGEVGDLSGEEDDILV